MLYGLSHLRLKAGTSRAQKIALLAVFSLLTAFLAIVDADPPSPSAATEPRRLPVPYAFEKSETVTYQARWNGIPVATAEVQGTPLSIEGKKFYHVEIQAKTMSLIDYIWQMRDTITSTFDTKTFQPHRFVFLQRENRRSTDTTATFDQDKNRWSVQRQRGSKLARFDFTSSSTLDPITAAYILRSIDLKVGDRLQFDVFGGKSRYLLTLDVVGRETITLNSSPIDTYKIVPQVRNVTKEGYSERVRQATVWVSADERRIPLRIVSKVFIGSVHMELQKDSVQLKKAAAPKLAATTSLQ
jgi:hypothetical protein